MMIRRTTGCMAMVLLLMFLITITNVQASTSASQSSANDDALQLLVIELFFLLIGLLVASFVGYLVWQSRRKKKKTEKEKGK